MLAAGLHSGIYCDCYLFTNAMLPVQHYLNDVELKEREACNGHCTRGACIHCHQSSCGLDRQGSLHSGNRGLVSLHQIAYCTVLVMVHHRSCQQCGTVSGYADGNGSIARLGSTASGSLPACQHVCQQCNVLRWSNWCLS